MKILFCSLLFINTIIAQYSITTLRQPTFLGSLRSFHYNGSVLYAVGYNFGIDNYVSKSTDLGITWQQVASSQFNAGDNIQAISFIDENTGVVGGDNGSIYRTTNGGTTWTNVGDTNIYNSGINQIQMINQNIGYVCGSYSNTNPTIVLKTTNGGLNWFAVPTPLPTYTAYDMLWENENKGLIVLSSGRILSTTDGGANWNQYTTLPDITTLFRIRKANDSVYYICGGTGTTSRVYKSTDGGATFNGLSALPFTGALYSMEIFDENNFIVFGSNGISARSTNGGSSWINLSPFTTEVIRTSINLSDRVLAGAYNSSLSISYDNGVSWSSISNTTRILYGINSNDGLKIVTVGERGEVSVSSNSGATWKRAAFSTGNLLYDVVSFGNLILTCGQSASVYLSTDNGNSWSSRSIGSGTERHYKLFFFNQNTGYMTSNEGNIRFTTNQGLPWNTQATFASTTLYDIKMVTQNIGYAVGSGNRIFKTTDGTTWSHGTLATPTEQITAVFMLNENLGYISGENGAVYKTTDGFQTITPLTNPSLLTGKTVHDIYAFDENNVFAVTVGGLILRTTNPLTMSVIDTVDKGNDLYSITKLSSNSLAIAGEGGMVYKLTDAAVPVELQSFTASKMDGKVLLKWDTASELNNKGFEIHKKRLENDWEMIGFVAGNGTTTHLNEYSFYDNNLSSGKNFYRLKQIDFDGSFSYSDIVEVGSEPISFSLDQNFPNPFNPATTIRYQIPKECTVDLKIYDILGNEVAAIINNEYREAGTYSIEFDTHQLNLSSSIYFYQMKAGNFVETKKLMLMK